MTKFLVIFHYYFVSSIGWAVEEHIGNLETAKSFATRYLYDTTNPTKECAFKIVKIAEKVNINYRKPRRWLSFFRIR